MDQRDIVLVSFPYSDLKSEKARPVIVISNNDYNKKFEDIIVVPLTSNLNARDYTISLSNKDLEKGSLLKESKVKVDRIFSFNKKNARLIIGRINKIKFNEIKDIIYNLIS